MSKTLFIIFITLISNSIFAQNRDFEYDYYIGELTDIEINEILNFPIYDLQDNKTITELKRKLNSELNSIASVMVHYKFAKTLKLTSLEQTELETRMVVISDRFAKQNKYVLLKLSGGYAPTFGIKEELISGKKVMILLLGGDCIIDEMEIKQEKIYTLFNDEMKKNILE